MNPEIVLKEIVDYYRVDRNISLRKFASEAKVSQSILTRVLHGKIKLSAKQAERILDHVQLPEVLSDKLKQSYFGKTKEVAQPSQKKEFVDVAAKNEEIKWFDLAILDYFTIQRSRQDLVSISNRMGLSQNIVMESIERLENLGLIKMEGESYVKTVKKLVFQGDKDMGVIRGIHSGLGSRALEAIKDVSESAVNKRYVTSYTLAIDPEKLSEAKKRVDEFQEELIQYLGSNRSDAVVYGWSNFLVPLIKGA